MSNYPDNAKFTAMEAQVATELSSDADADLAVLDMLKRRIAALTKFLNAWTPRTDAGEDADYALTEALDAAASAVRTAEDQIAERETL